MNQQFELLSPRLETRIVDLPKLNFVRSSTCDPDASEVSVCLGNSSRCGEK